MNENLGILRKKIDEINLNLLDLINQRAFLVKEVARLKAELDIENLDTRREIEMMENVLKNNNGPLPNELVNQIFATVFTVFLKFMGLNKEKNLLVSSSSPKSCNGILDMFDINDKNPFIIAGPCAIEKMEYLEMIAKFLQKNGLRFLRAGAYKPRTSPHEFQGLREEGLKMLQDVARRYNLYTVTEVVDTRDVETVSRYVDVLQVGSRNMHNFELLREVGQSTSPVLLKRGMSATIQEFILAAEHVLIRGNNNIILCERGIRTYETQTRNTLDISAIPIIKKETQLPIIVDLSHSLGRKDIVKSMCKAVLAAGSDGIMIEVHPFPEAALCDSKQQLNLEEAADFLNFVRSFYLK